MPPPRPTRSFWIALALVVIAFGVPLYELMRFALGSSLYSHIVLIPFAAIYFIWTGRTRSLVPFQRAVVPAVVSGSIGGALLLGALLLSARDAGLPIEDRLALMTGSFLAFGFAVCAWFLGWPALRQLAFPLGFLLFMIPFPTFVEHGLVTMLQHGSAPTALMFFKIYGTPVLADGLMFDLPGFRMNVAPECSGIHSSLVLLIVSVAASHLFLNTAWKRATLVLAVIPLALLRNGLRIFVIGQLCVDVGPHMIHSAIHRQGGPVFFALSLVPLFLLLFVLWKSERKRREPEGPTGGLAPAPDAPAAS